MSESHVEEVSPEGAEPDDVLRDGTLGGYLEAHDRPPAFEGPDRHPYTVSVEVEKVRDLREPYGCYLVFPRWAANAMGIVGHLETSLLGKAATRDEARAVALELSLVEVQRLLDQAVEEARERDDSWSSFPPTRSGGRDPSSGPADESGQGG